ncbi:multiple sugar transport system permease protein [Nakamurella sp. UYEF19]|uniref:carbohydrate ABC transporter permease n=1 Tax=Nakamurella sp. UYEF19 TaxID=1756392 RepID=UPI00339B2BFA
MAWQRTKLDQPTTWVGWSNFSYVFTLPELPQAAINTVYFMGLALLIGFPVPLVLAVVISSLRTKRWLYNILSYLPVVLPPVVAILLWKVFYDPGSTGLFNTVLGWFGLGPFAWLNSPDLAMPSLVLESTWAAAGSTVIIYLAAMASVPKELYEAAELDGAGIWRKIWTVTLPQIRGIILIVLLLQIIGTAQVFAEPFLFTGGGPANRTITLLMLIYNYAFVYNDLGAASAISAMLAVALAIISGLYFLATRRWSR